MESWARVAAGLPARKRMLVARETASAGRLRKGARREDLAERPGAAVRDRVAAVKEAVDPLVV